MRVFVTGASGWIGSGLVPDLLGSGHEVVGLARSEESAATLESTGVEVLRGSLDDIDSLEEGAAKSDGVVHLAFTHEFGDYQRAVDADLKAVKAMGEVLVGSDRPLVIASGMGGLRSSDLLTEADGFQSGMPRADTAIATLALADRGVRSSVVRLPPTVHGRGDFGFVPTLVGIAQAKGFSAYIGEGANRWSAVHRDDAARLFQRALESASAGSVAHAVGDEGVPTKTIAETIGRRLDVPVRSIAVDEANEHFGFLGLIYGLDLGASGRVTEERLGWHPEGVGLLEDMEEGHYFAEGASRPGLG